MNKHEPFRLSVTRVTGEIEIECVECGESCSSEICTEDMLIEPHEIHEEVARLNGWLDHPILCQDCAEYHNQEKAGEEQAKFERERMGAY